MQYLKWDLSLLYRYPGLEQNINYVAISVISEVIQNNNNNKNCIDLNTSGLNSVNIVP